MRQSQQRTSLLEEEEEDDDDEHDDVSIGKKPAGHANWSTHFQHLLQVKKGVAFISFGGPSYQGKGYIVCLDYS